MEAGDTISVTLMASEFLKKYQVDDIEEKILLIGYYNYFDRFKEFIKEGRK